MVKTFSLADVSSLELVVGATGILFISLLSLVFVSMLGETGVMGAEGVVGDSGFPVLFCGFCELSGMIVDVSVSGDCVGVILLTLLSFWGSVLVIDSILILFIAASGTRLNLLSTEKGTSRRIATIAHRRQEIHLGLLLNKRRASITANAM